MSFPLDDRSSTTSLLNGESYMEDNGELRYHGKHTKWIKFPFRRIIQLIICLIIISILISSTIGSIIGYKKYTKLVFPHSEVHASLSNLSDKSKIVQPYFKPDSTGTLVIKLWFREGSNESDNIENHPYLIRNAWYEEQRRIQMGGEQGFMEPQEGQNDWKEVWSVDVQGLRVEDTKRMEEKVVLPRYVVHSLNTNNRSSLVYTFELIPTTSSLPNNLKYNHTSTRPIKLYGSSQPWPLSYSPLTLNSNADITPLDAFLSHSAVGQSIHSRIPDYRHRTRWTDDEEENYVNFINTRTWITMAKDYSIYGVEGFKGAMDNLRVYKDSCANQEYYWGDCYRQFSNDGHFENLLSIEDQLGNKEWKYGPFLTTRLNPSAMQDYVELPKGSLEKLSNSVELEDFTFNWQITYSSLSPAKLSLAKLSYGSDAWGVLSDDGQTALNYDNHEFSSALLGLSFNPESRPITRGFIHILSAILRYVATPFIFHYWITRKTTTGITSIPLTIQSIVDLITYIVISALNFEFVYIFIFILTVVGFVIIILKQIYLFFKPEFMLVKTKIPLMEIELPLPTAIRFRSDSVEEKKSFEYDLKLDWRLRIIASIITFCIFRFAPSAPHLISATKYSNVMQGFGGAVHWDPQALDVIHIFRAIQGSVWLVSQISQNQSFGGSYAITTYLLFTSLFLSHITKIFVGWFGRAQMMQPFSIWDLISLILSGIMVGQAIMLKPVDQVVNEVVD